jgi:aspartate ammonia-lyase
MNTRILLSTMFLSGSFLIAPEFSDSKTERERTSLDDSKEAQISCSMNGSAFTLEESRFCATDTQEIYDVRAENLRINVYNAKGEKISSMPEFFRTVKAKTESFFVLQSDTRIETYDANCNQLGSMFATGKVVMSAIGSTFTTEEEIMGTVIYDSKCNKISSPVSANSDDMGIYDVRAENLRINVYNANNTKISSMPEFFRTVKAKTSTFFVLQSDTRIETYDANCNQLGSMFATGKVVLSASGSNFTTEENELTIVVYDSKCNRVSSRIK